MIEAALNGIWFVVAVAVVAASWRCSRRTKIALICAVALLFPIISISDDLNADRTLSDAMAIIVIVVLAMALIALARIRSTTFSPYVVTFATPSDPRSPPQR